MRGGLVQRQEERAQSWPEQRAGLWLGLGPAGCDCQGCPEYWYAVQDYQGREGTAMRGSERTHRRKSFLRPGPRPPECCRFWQRWRGEAASTRRGRGCGEHRPQAARTKPSCNASPPGGRPSILGKARARFRADPTPLRQRVRAAPVVAHGFGSLDQAMKASQLRQGDPFAAASQDVPPRAAGSPDNKAPRADGALNGDETEATRVRDTKTLISRPGGQGGSLARTLVGSGRRTSPHRPVSTAPPSFNLAQAADSHPGPWAVRRVRLLLPAEACRDLAGFFPPRPRTAQCEQSSRTYLPWYVVV